MGVRGPLRGSPIVARRSTRDPLDGEMKSFLVLGSCLLVLGACGEGAVRRDERGIQILASASVPEGHWFGGDGREEFQVKRSGNEFTAAWLLPQEYPYRLAEAVAMPDGLHLWIEGPGSRREYRLHQVKAEIWSLTTVESSPGNPEHGYTLTKDPSVAWLAEATAHREIEEQSKRVERFVDWLVRTL